MAICSGNVISEPETLARRYISMLSVRLLKKCQPIVMVGLLEVHDDHLHQWYDQIFKTRNKDTDIQHNIQSLYVQATFCTFDLELEIFNCNNTWWTTALPNVMVTIHIVRTWTWLGSETILICYYGCFSSESLSQDWPTLFEQRSFGLALVWSLERWHKPQKSG